MSYEVPQLEPFRRMALDDIVGIPGASDAGKIPATLLTRIGLSLPLLNEPRARAVPSAY